MRQSRWPRVPMAEHREPCESRGSRTVLGAPGGEIPPGDSTLADIRGAAIFCPLLDKSGHELSALPRRLELHHRYSAILARRIYHRAAELDCKSLRRCRAGKIPA